MIAFDVDGTILNYDGHASGDTRYNLGLLPLVQSVGTRMVAIVTNQGGMAFSRTNHKYPTPLRVGQRINEACTFMRRNGFSVMAVHVSCYHPKAETADIEWAARKLRGFLALLPCDYTVYTTERARKPHPLMLRAAGATIYYGDSPEDGQAANAAGVPFVEVPRFL